MTTESDPRIFFAAERTLLAWVRTGIAIMALGFVVAKFGLFIRLLAHQGQTFVHDQQAASSILGIGFIVLGAIAIIAAAIQQYRFVATIAHQDLPSGYSKNFTVCLTLLIAALGMGLAFYLLET